MEGRVRTPLKEFVCILAGPVGGFVMLLFVRWLPRTAVCCLVHSMYNLLPVYPLDGGRALRIVVSTCVPVCVVNRCCAVFERGVKLLVVLMAVWGTLALHWGILPLLLASAILIKTKTEKSLAN